MEPSSIQPLEQMAMPTQMAQVTEVTSGNTHFVANTKTACFLTAGTVYLY